MANNDSLKWSIEKIIDCDGNDITTGSWVSINPMEGFGDTHASVSITPSEKYNDCQTATVTILTGTGDKKYVTINRCNPECNCDAIKFFPIELKNNIPASGGTVQVASYEMKYDCSDAYMDFINVESECKYEFGNGTVYAVVGENESTTSNREFEYYVTYNGTKCDNGSQSGSFSQDMAEDECVKEECNIDVYSTTISSIAWNVTEIDFKVDNLTDCWTLDYIGEHSGYDFTYFMSGEYITINVGSNDDYNNERPFEFIFVFKNGAANKSCEIETDVITQGKRPVVQTCTTCTDIKIQKTYPSGQYKQFNSEGSNGKPETIGEFNVSCHPEGGLELVPVESQTESFVTNATLYSVSNTSYKITGIVTKNENASKRYETFQIRLKNSKEQCSTIFGVEQLGKEPAPSDTCDIDAESVVYTTDDTDVIERYKHMLSAFDHSNYSDPNKEIDYYDTFSETGKLSFEIFKKDSNGQEIPNSRIRINDYVITVTGLTVNKEDGKSVYYDLKYVDTYYKCGEINKRITIPQRGYTLSMVIKEPLRQGDIDIGSDYVRLHSCRYGDYNGTLIPSFHIHDNGLPPGYDVFEVIDEEMKAEFSTISSHCCCDNNGELPEKDEKFAHWFGEIFRITENNIVYEKFDTCDNDKCPKRSGCVTCNDYDFQDGDRELVAVFTVFDTEFYIHIFDA